VSIQAVVIRATFGVREIAGIDVVVALDPGGLAAQLAACAFQAAVRVHFGKADLVAGTVRVAPTATPRLHPTIGVASGDCRTVEDDVGIVGIRAVVAVGSLGAGLRAHGVGILGADAQAD
jgi:hypothetical protein